MLNKPEQNIQVEPPDMRVGAAAVLFVLGGAALAEYGERRGYDMSAVCGLHGEAVAAWADAWGCDRSRIEFEISNLRAQFCSGVLSDAVRGVHKNLNPTCTPNNH